MSRESALKNATIDYPNFDTPTWEAAATRKAQSLGITLPKDFKTVARNYANSHTGVFDWANKTLNNVNALVDSYAQNPKAFYEKALYEAGYKYATTKIYTNSADSQKATKYANADKNMSAIVASAYSSGIPVSSITKLIEDGGTYVVQDYEKGVKKNQSWFDTFFDVASNITLAVATGGLSLPQQIAFNAAFSVINGASATDVIRGVVGAVAADQVVDVLKDVNSQISAAGPNAIKPEIASALANAERQAVNAAILKQDIGKAALAGAAGGAAASASSLLTDSKALQKASGEFVKNLAAGKTTEQALTGALTGYLVSTAKEKDDAEKAIKSKVATDISNLDWSQLTPAQQKFLNDTSAAVGLDKVQGRDVSEATFTEARENWPKIFADANYRYDPSGKVGDVYTLQNKEGQTVYARPVTNDNGTFIFLWNPTTNGTASIDLNTTEGQSLGQQLNEKSNASLYKFDASSGEKIDKNGQLILRDGTASGLYVDKNGTLLDPEDPSFKSENFIDPSALTQKVDATTPASSKLPSDFKPVQTKDEQLLALVNTGGGTSGGKGGGTSGSAGNVSISTGGTGTGNTGGGRGGGTGNATGNATSGTGGAGAGGAGGGTGTGGTGTGGAGTGTGGTGNVRVTGNTTTGNVTTGNVTTGNVSTGNVTISGNTSANNTTIGSANTTDNTILLDLLNQPLNRPLLDPTSPTTTPTQPQGSPGSAALAQALRIGDAGSPIFGKDEEGRRSGWNLKSLRYMGDVGAEK
jgi:hypothetical protein